MTEQVAMAILNKYRHWNTGQTSVDFAFYGTRTAEDDILDARRELILKATKALADEKEKSDEVTNN